MYIYFTILSSEELFFLVYDYLAIASFKASVYSKIMSLVEKLKHVFENLKVEFSSLDEKLYNWKYAQYESDRTINGENAKQEMNTSGYLRFFTSSVATALALGTLYYGRKKKLTRRDLLVSLGLITFSAGLASHFHNYRKIFEAMYKKNSGHVLRDQELTEVKEAGRSGRYSHAIAVTGLGISTGAAVTVNRRVFMVSLPAIPLFFGFYYVNMHKGYNAAYAASIDYVTGERRSFTGTHHNP